MSFLTLSLLAYWPGQDLYRQLILYKWGLDTRAEYGHEKITSGPLYEETQQALRAMNIPYADFITIYKAHHTALSTPWHVWVNEKPTLPPWEFIPYHEVAHIALGHAAKRYFQGVSYEEARAQEVEADLFAYQKLFELGRVEVIVERFKQLKRCIDLKAQQPDPAHPSIEEMYAYTENFLRSKGVHV